MRYLMLARRVPALDALHAWAAAPAGDAFYLEHPAEGTARLALGRRATITASGPERFESCARGGHELLSRIERCGDPGAPDPFLAGGFAFADGPARAPWRRFPSAEWVLPERALLRRGEETWLTATAPLRDGPAKRQQEALNAVVEDWRRRIEVTRLLPAEPAAPLHRVVADEAPAGFMERVEDALAAIAEGEAEKLVLARGIRVEREHGFDRTALLAELREHAPSSATFAVARGGTCFLGATPERLLRRRGLEAESMALAGTMPRGRNPEEDAEFARRLRESKKEQEEHAVVVRFLREQLSQEAEDVTALEAPEILPLEAMQHLKTRVSARLARPVPLLRLAGRLHPTPATAGMPRSEALAWLRRNEPLERGWYAGPLGFTDASGDGELWVALRCGLLREARAHLFAGAGIVAGSQPGAELRETRLKFGTLLSRLLEV